MIRFDPPKTQAELDEILRICRFTSYGPEEQSAIHNVIVRHLDPRSPFCGGCGDAVKWQTTISQIATQRSADWQAAIDQAANQTINDPESISKTEEDSSPSLFDRITKAVDRYMTNDDTK